MKTLIGKIFRTDDGREVIERIPQNRVDWKISEKSDGTGYWVTCPRCGRQHGIRTDINSNMSRLIDRMYTDKWHSMAYCGYCGRRNITVPVDRDNEEVPF